MNGDDRDFLGLLGYLYLQYGRADEARTIYATLFELATPKPKPLLALTYSYCLAQSGQYAVAYHHLQGIDSRRFSLKERSAFFLLRGNVLWHLGRDSEAREALDLFLAAERKRARKESVRLSLLATASKRKLASQKVETPLASDSDGASLTISDTSPTTAPLGNSRKIRVTNGEGIWRRTLRFIARKELNREHSRQN